MNSPVVIHETRTLVTITTSTGGLSRSNTMGNKIKVEKYGNIMDAFSAFDMVTLVILVDTCPYRCSRLDTLSSPRVCCVLLHVLKVGGLLLRSPDR